MTTEYYPPFPLGHKGPEGSKGPGRSATGHLNNIPAPKYAYISTWVLYNMESKLCGSYHCRGCILFELSNFVEEYHCRSCIVFELSNFVEDVFQGFKVLYNMKRKLCGFYIIWKANFVGRITLESKLCGSLDVGGNQPG